MHRLPAEAADEPFTMVNANHIHNLNECGNLPQRRSPLRSVRRAGAESSGLFWRVIETNSALSEFFFFRADSLSCRTPEISILHPCFTSVLFLPAVGFMCKVIKEGKEHVKLTSTIPMKATGGTWRIERRGGFRMLGWLSVLIFPLPSGYYVLPAGSSCPLRSLEPSPSGRAPYQERTSVNTHASCIMNDDRRQRRRSPRNVGACANVHAMQWEFPRLHPPARYRDVSPYEDPRLCPNWPLHMLAGAR